MKAFNSASHLLPNSFVSRYYPRLSLLEGKTETYLRFFGQYLEGFPVRTINFSDKTDKARHDKVVSLVEQMMQAKQQLASARTDRVKSFYENKCAALDRQIDRLVYELYSLTDEEIAIIETTGSTTHPIIKPRSNGNGAFPH